jgi:hypothetical protein
MEVDIETISHQFEIITARKNFRKLSCRDMIDHTFSFRSQLKDTTIHSHVVDAPAITRFHLSRG